MKNKRGFTLIEILLAAMIVGLIGLSLGAISTAALRESGVARTRMILRNQLSLALRQLRQDIQEANTVTTNNSTADGTELLKLTYDPNSRLGLDPTNRKEVVYTLRTDKRESAPGGGTVRNRITRTVKVPGRADVTKDWLENVKVISGGAEETYPSFTPIGGASGKDSRIIARLIVQPYGEVVINETVRLVMVSSAGAYTTDPCLPGGLGTCEL